MIIPDKKKAVTAIISRMHEGKEESPRAELSPSVSSQDDAGLHAISEDAIAAFQSKNASDLTQALKAFWAEMENRSEGE